MKDKLDKLRKIKAANSVTLILNTHRTAPDNQKDPLQLKNFIRKAAEKLETIADKKTAEKTVEKLQTLAESIDHSHNLEGLLLFVNETENISEYLRIPLSVTDRVVVGESFATRDILRATQQSANYFILVLNQQKTRLIQAVNDEVVQEYNTPFPYINVEFRPQPGAEAADAQRSSHLLAEYFNRIDKEVNKIRKEDGNFPVLLNSEEENVGEYMKIADDKESLLTSVLNGNRQDEKAAAIVRDAWEMVRAKIETENTAKFELLENAVTSGNFLSDVSEIYSAISEGRVQTLFVEEDLFQPATVEGNTVTTLSETAEKPDNYVTDIFDDMISKNADFGGETVFLPEGSLAKFQGFAAVTRY